MEKLGLAFAARPVRGHRFSIILFHNAGRDYGIKSGRGARPPAALAAVAAKKAEIVKAECAEEKSNGLEGESPSGLADNRQSLERKN